MKLKSRYLLLPESNSGSEAISSPSPEVMENNTPVSHDDEENMYEEGDFDAIEAEEFSLMVMMTRKTAMNIISLIFPTSCLALLMESSFPKLLFKIFVKSS